MLKHFPRSFEARVPAVLRYWRGAAARARPAILGLQRYARPRQFSPRFVLAIMPSRWRFYQAAPDRASSLGSAVARTRALKRAVEAKASTIVATPASSTARSSRTVTSSPSLRAAADTARAHSEQTVALPSPLRVAVSATRVMEAVGAAPVRRARAPLRSVVRSRATPASPQIEGPVRAALAREERATSRSVVRSRVRDRPPRASLPAHASRRFLERILRISSAPAQTPAPDVSPRASSWNSSSRRRIAVPTVSSTAQHPRPAFAAHVRATETRSFRFAQSTAAAGARRERSAYEFAPRLNERALRKTLRGSVALSSRPLERSTARTATDTPRLRLVQHRPHVISAEPSAPRPQARMSLRQGPTSSHSHASPSSSAHPSSSTPERRRASRIDQEESVRNGAQSEPTVAQTRRLLMPLVQETVFSERSISRLASGVMARLDRNDSAEAYRKSGGR